MSKFFDQDEEEFDSGVARNHADRVRTPHAAPPHENGGISNEAFLNDYRNRMPFHYIEQGTEGYYYWQYGATMEIEFEISDEIAFSDPTPPYVVDVRINGKSITDKATGIANIILGTMAKENKSDYYTIDQAKQIIDRILSLAKQAEEEAKNAKERSEKLAHDLYALIGQDPGPGDDFTVIPNIPFTLLLKKDQTKVTVNGEEFLSIICVDASDTHKQLNLSLEDFPKEMPIVAVYNTLEEVPRLLTGFACLPLDYIHRTVIPAVERDAKIQTHNLALTEITI